MISSYLDKLQFTKKEQKLYLSLAELGIQPASVIAKKCQMDRVTAYKNLKSLADRGFVKIYYRNGIQCFGIESFKNIEAHLKEKVEAYAELLAEFPTAENLLKSLHGETDLIPKLEIFEGEAGIKRFFRDLLFEIKQGNLRQIRMLTSNTFAERLGDVPLSRFVQDFFTDLKEQQIDLEIFEATGDLLPTGIHKIMPEQFDPEKLPAARGTTHIFIAGHAVYLACYKNSQIGLKIKQNEISQIFHFLFDVMGKKIQ